jgi:hypothetical protein
VREEYYYDEWAGLGGEDAIIKRGSRNEEQWPLYRDGTMVQIGIMVRKGSYYEEMGQW